MRYWTIPDLLNAVEGFGSLPPEKHGMVLDYLNEHYPIEIFEEHKAKRRNALQQMNRTRNLLHNATQHFPLYVTPEQLSVSGDSLKHCAIVFTAGGEGERLRLSLLKKGYPPSALDNFTKATFPLTGFGHYFGTLPINLIMVAFLCEELGITIPVVITTGPVGSVTASIIPALLEKYNNFGLTHLQVVSQGERLFLTNEERIVLQESNDSLLPITHPDETGGPLMKLKAVDPSTGVSLLQWFDSIGCSKTIIIQATALYHPDILPIMASALDDHDCLGTGILRTTFPSSDPYGTFVTLRTAHKTVTTILEQNVRNEVTRSITDASGSFFLPFNTGFYAFKNSLLQQNDLPDFATPPKELRPDLPRAPKIGFAATDLITLAHDPIILAINSSTFGVVKNADDLDTLSTLGKKFGLQEKCQAFMRRFG